MENVPGVRDFMRSDRRLTVKRIMEKSNLTHITENHIIIDELEYERNLREEPFRLVKRTIGEYVLTLIFWKSLLWVTLELEIRHFNLTMAKTKQNEQIKDQKDVDLLLTDKGSSIRNVSLKTKVLNSIFIGFLKDFEKCVSYKSEHQEHLGTGL
ncbi:hypothetical protein Trydic_g13078 [Trypoxylus dichotomus]